MSDPGDSGWCANTLAEPEVGPSVTDDPALDFESVYRDHYGFVWRCAWRMGVEAGELEDVLQDTFVVAHRRFSTWNQQVRATTWLFGILRNVVRNRSRAGRRRTKRLDLLAHEPSSRAPDERELMIGELLRRFLLTLDEDKRAVFVLADLEGMTAAEIGAALGLSPNTVSSRLRVARQHLREHFDDIESVTARARTQPDQPPAGASERTLALVLATPGLGKTTAIVSAAKLGRLGLAKWMVGTSVAALAVVGASASVGPSEDEAPTLAVEPRVSSAEPPRLVRSAAANEAIDAEAIVVVAGAEPSRPTRSAKLEASDEAERESLRMARELLVDGQAQAALDRLETMRGLEPGLDASRAATRIAALCRLARTDEAEATWIDLRTRHADSPLVGRTAESCWSPSPDDG